MLLRNLCFISRKDIESNQSFGYWQNIKYLEPFKDKILRDISFDVNEKNLSLLRKYQV